MGQFHVYLKITDLDGGGGSGGKGKDREVIFAGN